MFAGVIVLVFLAVAGIATPQTVASASSAERQSAKETAQTLALVGHNQLHLIGRLSDAQSNCDAALKLDPSNETAKDCLDRVSLMLVDQDLNTAESKLLSGDKASAISLASKWVPVATGEAQARAQDILKRAQVGGFRRLLGTLVPNWLREVLAGILVFALLALFLLGARRLWREWKRGDWYGNTTKWRMLPFKEIPEDAKGQTGVSTNATLDALTRLGYELSRDLWQPKLLLLRPTRPGSHEPPIIDSFRSESLCDVLLVPAAEDLQIQWRLHDVQLDQAVENFQFKAPSGMDIGSLARLIRGIVDWLNFGAPTISGVANIESSKEASIQLCARGGRLGAVAVKASTEFSPGIDPIQLSAERAAFKFLFRMQYPGMTNDQIDGFAALRQGARQFEQFASAVSGEVRKASLKQAAFNFGFFRTSVPPHCKPPADGKDRPSLSITPQIRQAVLLAEGIAHCLVGEKQNYWFAIACFRQLQDWPGSEDTRALRQQAAYNEAIVWRELGSLGQCVLMLTSLLGERAPDTIEPTNDTGSGQENRRATLPDAIRLPAHVARLATFARYDRNEWSSLPPARADLILNDGVMLIRDLADLKGQADFPASDRRVVDYLYSEALRALGHIELMRTKTGPAYRFYKDLRPIGLRNGSLAESEKGKLRQAISWMLICEQLAPDCGLYCDLAEAYLLLKEFSAAQGYARHATLRSSSQYERSYYLATESYLLQGTAESRTLAQTYAEDFKGEVSLEEFKAVRAELQVATAAAA